MAALRAVVHQVRRRHHRPLGLELRLERPQVAALRAVVHQVRRRHQRRLRLRPLNAWIVFKLKMAYRHVRSDAQITFRATSPDGSALPTYASFDAAHNILSGTAPDGVAQLDVEVIAVDGEGFQNSANLNLNFLKNLEGLTMTRFLNTLSVAVIAVSLLGSAPAEAARPKKGASPAAAPATPATPATPAAAPVEWELKNTFGKWELLCNKGNATDCRAVQTQNYSDDTTKGRLLQALLANDQGRTFAVLTLPFGVDLRAGTVIKIDEGVEVKATYTTCLPDGCQSVVELDESLQSQVTAGKVMKVGFRPWGGDEKTLVVEVPLDGAKDVLAVIKK